jgi:glycine/sarcosine N-methyltransferase
VAALDNALPHLTSFQLKKAVRAMGSKLEPHGLLMASIRDYDNLILQRPAIQEPAFYGEARERRIVHQIWDWIDNEQYALHLYITMQAGAEWRAHHFVTKYRCLLRAELDSVLISTGFEQVQWLMPEQSGFYQPIVLARKGNQPITVK